MIDDIHAGNFEYIGYSAMMKAGVTPAANDVTSLPHYDKVPTQRNLNESMIMNSGHEKITSYTTSGKKTPSSPIRNQV
jgi:hypothetical protein